MKIGILALQGAFREHKQMIDSCGCEAVEVRKPAQLDDVDGLIIPGGESTTIGKLANEFKIIDKLKERAAKGMPIFGTCAGLIFIAKDIKNSDQHRLGLMDMCVERNAFGRQIDSFEADININVLGNKPFPAVFIRAPYIEQVAPNVGILAEYDGKIVFARQGNYLACAFHPELTDDNRIHNYFIDMVKESKEKLS